MVADTKFTPGRLSVEDPQHLLGQYQILRDHDGETVAHIRDMEYSKFLAAAPDLYAALEAVEWLPVNAMNVHHCPDCTGEKPDHKPGCQLDAALRKARGEAVSLDK